MQTVSDSDNGAVDVLPVTVVSRTFPARPSSFPDIRDFVRQQLARTPLSADNVRVLCQRVADVLLDAAGASQTIDVSLRMFANYAEVDVLQTNHDVLPANQGEAASNPGAVFAPSPPVADPSRLALALAPGTTSRPTAATGERAERQVDQAAGLPAVQAAGQPKVSFAEWLAEELRREGMTMEAASRQLRVSVKTVSRWVRGATEPRLCDLSRIREIFGDLPFL